MLRPGAIRVDVYNWIDVYVRASTRSHRASLQVIIIKPDSYLYATLTSVICFTRIKCPEGKTQNPINHIKLTYKSILKI